MAKPLNSIALVNTTLISHSIDTVHAPPQILPGELNMEADRYLAMSDDYYASVDTLFSIVTLHLLLSLKIIIILQ